MLSLSLIRRLVLSTHGATYADAASLDDTQTQPTKRTLHFPISKLTRLRAAHAPAFSGSSHHQAHARSQSRVSPASPLHAPLLKHRLPRFQAQAFWGFVKLACSRTFQPPTLVTSTTPFRLQAHARLWALRDLLFKYMCILLLFGRPKEGLLVLLSRMHILSVLCYC
ncbi:hypothetical protein C8Q72DRAFT_823243 [Fomitopsis betulina]|nr:hypothetical protein C8Q72DRAFT_823243 [Fomitopsis betulina]